MTGFPVLMESRAGEGVPSPARLSRKRIAVRRQRLGTSASAWWKDFIFCCEARSIAECVRRIAVDWVPNGYMFYVRGEIPEGKDPAKTDEKIIREYDIDISKWQRSRRKRQGIARVQYLRLGRQFVILA